MDKDNATKILRNLTWLKGKSFKKGNEVLGVL